MKAVDVLKYQFNQLWSRKPSNGLFFILEVFFQGIIPILLLYLTKTIIDIISSQNSAPNEMMMSMLIRVLFVLVSISISMIAQHHLKMEFVLLRQTEVFDMNTMFQEIDYIYLENKEALDNIHTSIQPLFGLDGFQGVL